MIFRFYDFAGMHSIANGTRIVPFLGDTLESAITPYQKGDKIKADFVQFDEGQESIVFPSDQIPEFVTVMSVAGFSNPNWESENTRPVYYTITRMERFISREGTQYTRLFIRRDAWLSDYCKPEAQKEGGIADRYLHLPSIVGRVDVTTQDRLVEWSNFDKNDTYQQEKIPREPLEELPTSGFSTTIVNGYQTPFQVSEASITSNEWVLASFTGERNNYLLAFCGLNFEGERAYSLKDTIEAVSNIIQRQTHGDTKENVSVNGVYLIPSAWITPLGLIAYHSEKPPIEKYERFDYDDNHKFSGLIYGFPIQQAMTERAEPFIDLGTIEIPMGEPKTDPYLDSVLRYPHMTAYFFTPKRFVRLSGDMTVKANRTVHLVGDFQRIADGTSFAIYAEIQDEIVDITEDFAIPIVRNEEVIRQAQFPVQYSINAIANVLGSVGGAIGGFQSGNYFGAVQSIFGGVQTAGNVYMSRHQIGQTVNANSLASAVATSRGLCGFVWTIPSEAPSNIDARFGWNYPTKPHITVGVVQGDYYAFNNEQCSSLFSLRLSPDQAFYKLIDPRFAASFSASEEAQNEILSAYQNGVRIYTIKAYR